MDIYFDIADVALSILLLDRRGLASIASEPDAFLPVAVFGRRVAKLTKATNSQNVMFKFCSFVESEDVRFRRSSLPNGK